MAAKPYPERAEGDTSNDSVKKDKKKKKERKKRKEEEVGTKGQEQIFDVAVEDLAAERDKVEEKQSSKSGKSKHKLNDAGDLVAAVDGKKRKKEHPAVLEESSQKQTLSTTVENLAAERDKVEGKQSSKSKKSKTRGSDAGEACSGHQVVAREDKKRNKEHPVVLEESSQPKNTSKGENGKVTEKGREGNKSRPEFCEIASAWGEEANVDGTNDKKKRKSKEATQEGMEEKEKDVRSKNKGKRVSFADSAEVFRTEGGDSEGTEGENKKKEKAAQSKKKVKRMSFADSAEVFRTEGGDSEGIEGGKKKKKKAAQSKNKGKRVSFADSAEVFSIECGDSEGIEEGKKKKKVAQSKNKGKRVSFADSAEVFSIEGGDGEEGGSSDESKFVHGQRFTPEEDATCNIPNL